MKKTLLKLLFLAVMLFVAQASQAGVDLVVHVKRVQIAADGKMWFSVDGNDAPAYCHLGWNDLSMYVPPESPQYSYYYGILMASLLKGNSVIIANISIYNQSMDCDITRTGYGIILVS